MRERDVEKALVKGVEKLGGLCYKWTSPGNPGVPDRICIFPGGHIFFIELKAIGGKLSSKQEIQQREICKRTAGYIVLEGIDSVGYFLKAVETELIEYGYRKKVMSDEVHST